MERHTATPLIDGGIVTAPPNNASKHDVVPNTQRISDGKEQQIHHTSNEGGAAAQNSFDSAADTRPTNEMAAKLKGFAATAHGAGEMLRGNVNATVDRVLHDVWSSILLPAMLSRIWPRSVKL